MRAFGVARGVCSAILVFEAIVVLLASLVAGDLSGVDEGVALWIGAGFALACLVTTRLLRQTFGYVVGSALQVAMVASGLVVPVMFAIGTLFAFFWFLALHLATRIDATRRRHAPPG